MSVLKQDSLQYMCTQAGLTTVLKQDSFDAIESISLTQAKRTGPQLLGGAKNQASRKGKQICSELNTHTHTPSHTRKHAYSHTHTHTRAHTHTQGPVQQGSLEPTKDSFQICSEDTRTHTHIHTRQATTCAARQSRAYKRQFPNLF